VTDKRCRTASAASNYAEPGAPPEIGQKLRAGREGAAEPRGSPFEYRTTAGRTDLRSRKRLTPSKLAMARKAAETARAGRFALLNAACPHPAQACGVLHWRGSGNLNLRLDLGG
jgi:hypothetical protein